MTPRCRGVGTPRWAGPLTTSLRGLWVSGYLPRAMADRAQGRRPDNRPGGDDSDTGLASRRERGLTATKRVTLEPAWAASTHCEGKGPENPGVVAPFVEAGCRGNRRYGTFGRSQTSASSSSSRATLSSLSTPQICSGPLGRVCCRAPDVKRNDA